MSSLSTLPKGDSAWLLRKSIQRIMQQVSVLETNIGSSTTGNSANTQVIFNDNGTLRGDTGLTFNKTTDTLGTGRLTTSGDAIVCSSTGDFYVGTTLSPQFKVERATGAATITGDLTVATDRLKVVTASTAIQTGATTQLQVGTTSWPSTVIGKSGSRSLFGNAGEVIIWNEAAAAIGNYSTLFVTAKTGAGATTMGGLQIRAGIENASNSDGFVSLWTSNSAAGGFVERYKIDSTGVATWSNVGGVAGTAMTLNSTGLGVGGAPELKLRVDGPDAAPATSGSSNTNGAFRIGAAGASTNLCIDSGVSTTGGVYGWFQARSRGNYALNYDIVLNPNGGNVGVGVTPSGTGGCLQLKSGITFPATQVASSDANTLDDYEEGTFTPTVSATAGTLTTTTVNSATYTKIGRLVSVSVDISVVNIGTASGLLLFSLPFNQVADSNVGALRELGATGQMGQIIYQSATQAAVALYNNGTLIVNGYRFRGTYTYTV